MIVIQIDEADKHLLKQNKDGTWRFSLNSKGYVVISTPQGAQLLHRWILRPPPEMVVDHVNSDKLDNRRCNLRVCTSQESNQNLRATGFSPYIGAWFDKKKKRWKSYIRLHGRRKYLGAFKTDREAAIAYDQAVIKYGQDFCRTNFPRNSYH